MVKFEPKEKGKRREETYLRGLTSAVKHKRIAVFDLESKDGDTQKAGFTRPFQVGFYDGGEYIEFRNDPELAEIDWKYRHIARGGCLDKFLRWLFRLDGCHKCHRPLTQYNAQGVKHCMDCVKHRKRYGSTQCNIYSHNGGRFDELFMLGWLLQNRDKVKFDLTAVQARIQRLEVRPVTAPDQFKGKQARVSWTFLDSFALMPLSLAEIGKDLLGGAERFSAVKEAMDLEKQIAREREDVLNRNLAEQAHAKAVMALAQGLDPETETEAETVEEKLRREGKYAGNSKLAMDLDLEENHPAWEIYNKADNVVLYNGITRFHELMEGLGGEVGITAPASSMKLFRRAFQHRPIKRNRHFDKCDGVCHRGPVLRDGTRGPCADYCDGKCHGCAHAYIREGYYGGRTELFKRWGHRLFYYDINSSYPASMLEPMPVGDMHELDVKLSWDALRTIRRSHVGFLDVEVTIPRGCPIPPLPVRHEGKLVFPTGSFRGVWDFDELDLLSHPLVQGKVTKVHRSIWYSQEPVFREMVRVLYRYRQKHVDGCKVDKNSPEGHGTKCRKKVCNPDYTPGLAYVAKLMLNSLYGKFGMREDRESVVMVPPDEPKPADGWPLNGEHNSPFWVVEKFVDAAYIIPQISAHITTLSRRRLWHGMAEVIAKGGELYYVDTDSIMSSAEIDPSDELGGWKREDPDKLIDGEFILPKLYQLKLHKAGCVNPLCEGCIDPDAKLHRHDCKDKKTCPGCAVSVEKMKGVTYRAQTPENWKRMVYEREEIVGTRLTQHRTMLNNLMLSPEVVEAKKSLQTEYDKRVMLPDGSTVPLHIVR